MENYNKLSGAKSKNRADEIAAILPILLDNRKNIILNHLEIEKKKKIHTALLPLKVNKEIQDQLKFIEDENDLLMLSRFNVLINEQLRNEPSAFIYEKVGEQYQHYFSMNSRILHFCNGRIFFLFGIISFPKKVPVLLL